MAGTIKAMTVDIKKKAKSGCLTSNGGYLHPNGKYALIKATTYDLDDPEEGMDDSTMVGYSLVEIPASTKNAK